MAIRSFSFPTRTRLGGYSQAYTVSGRTGQKAPKEGKELISAPGRRQKKVVMPRQQAVLGRDETLRVRDEDAWMMMDYDAGQGAWRGRLFHVTASPNAVAENSRVEGEIASVSQCTVP